jgi:hypothetical protein
MLHLRDTIESNSSLHTVTEYLQAHMFKMTFTDMRRTRGKPTLTAGEGMHPVAQRRSTVTPLHIRQAPKAQSSWIPSANMFQPWRRLPTELKLEILQYALAQPDLITHSRHLDNLRVWLLSLFISARNKELAQLAIDACKL